MRKIHEFDNGIKVFDDQLLEIQRGRYKRRNVHEEDEEDVFVPLIKSLPLEATYVNVGTAIGYYPMLARKLRGDILIHCFEPFPPHLKFLRENITLNGYDDIDFHIHAFAISTKSGKAKFMDKSYGSSLSSGSESARKKRRLAIKPIKDAIFNLLGKTELGMEITVATLSLAEIFKEIGIKKIDLLQMDIQEFEEPVLGAYFAEENFGGGRIMQFLVSTHGEEIHAKCKSHLENAGFQILHDEQDTKHQPDGILLGSLISEGKL